MAAYVIADIHGQYDMFMELTEKIGLRDSDTLYILGDVVDRGPHPVKTLRKLMEMPNVVCLTGNHELMAVECLQFLMRDVEDITMDASDVEMLDNLLTWQYNGGQTTIDEFRALDRETRQAVYDFIREFLIYEELSAGGREYLLVHAGLGNFSPEKEMEDYSLRDLIWKRADYDTQYFEDVFVITGHTPTQLIKGNPEPGSVYRHKNHIAIDCGACFRGGRLAALCLDTDEVFYSSTNEG